MKSGITSSLRPKSTEQQKNREILSITNAAVQALTDPSDLEEHRLEPISLSTKQGSFIHVNGSSSEFSGRETSLSSDQRAVLKLGTDLSTSSSSQSLSGEVSINRMDLSSLDSSFNKNSAVRVRVPSTMLREIKPSFNSSVGRSVDPVLQPTPKVVRHSNGPSAWVSMSTSHPIAEHEDTMHGGPMSTTTVSTHEITQAKDLEVKWNENQKSFPQSSSLQHKAHSSRGTFVDVNSQDQAKDQMQSIPNSKSHEGIGLCQGEPVTGLITDSNGRQDSVKGKSFVLSQREKALKEEFTKRQDRRSAPIKRSVQPTIVPIKETQKRVSSSEELLTESKATENSVASAAAIAAAAASAATAPLLQVDARLKKLEELQQQILNTQGYQINQRPHVGHTHAGHGVMEHDPSMDSATSGFAHGSHIPANIEPSYPQVSTAVHHSLPPRVSQQPFTHQPLLQNQQFPSHMEGHIVNPSSYNISQPSFHSQTAQNQPAALQATMPYQNPVTQPFFSHQSSRNQTLDTATSSIIAQPFFTHQPVSSQTTFSHENSLSLKERIHRPIPAQVSTSHSTTSNNPSKQLFIHQPVQQPKAAMTCTETVHTQTLPTTYVPAKKLLQDETYSKFQAVKNSKTQTSPQDSSMSSSDSPLQTPLPRKKPPRPTPHSNSKGQLKYLPTRQKRVHFDPSDDHDPFLSYARYIPQEYKEQQRFQRVPNTRIGSTNIPYSEIPSARPITPLKEKDPGMEEVMGELSKMRSDLRNVLTETEKMKNGLSQQKISKEVENMFSHRGKESSLLESYLAKPTTRPTGYAKTLRIPAPIVDPCADIKQVLRDVQTQRNNLEYNLDAIVRQNEDENFYTLVDTMIHGAEGAEAICVHQNIDKMIKEINTAVKKEIDNESRKAQTKAEPSQNTNQDKPQPKSRFQSGKKFIGKSSGLPEKQQKKPGKENVPSSVKDKKVKNVRPASSTKSMPKADSKPVSKPVSSGKSQTYLTSVYGRQPYHAQRTTSKAPYLHYQSPVNPRTAALTSALSGAGNHFHSKHPLPEKPERERTEKSSIKEWDAPWSHLHPISIKSQVIPSGDGRVHVHAPLEGIKMPMAIPLGKPRTDPSLRLPLPTTSADSSGVQDEIPSQSTPGQPPNKSNVAVITIQHEGIEDEVTRKQRKSKEKRRRPDLAVQVLPQMDVDSLTTSGEEILPYDRHSTEMHTPVKRPDDIEYEDFRNYFAVKDTETNQEGCDEEGDEMPQIPTPENPLTIKGHTEKDRLYHGPPFPPEHPPMPSNPSSGVLDADKRVSDTIEDRALEWVEQELLARIVSEVNQPLPDPTLITRPPTPDTSDTSDDGNILAATIGLGGIQLFVDAGIPVDRDLVAVLIRDVVAEQIVSTLGYPKPTATPKQPQVEDSPQTREVTMSPVNTPVPTPVYTPAESESSVAESPKVTTPHRTPTPSESSVTTETEEEPTPVKEVSESKDEPEPKVSINKSPVQTPIATPTGSQTPIASISTPEPSTREPDVTDIGIPVLTPEPSVSVPSTSSVSLPTPSSVKSTETPPPPKPPTPVTTCSSIVSASTLSPSTTSTMTTVDEELSEGQLIQPYIHGGPYSEGEYAVHPDVVQLARERNLPVDPVEIMGKDEDSRNELIRIALHGLLRRGLYSTSSIDTTASVVSTLKDADDISKDSLADFSHSEGEVVFPRDTVPVFRAPQSLNTRGYQALTQHRSKASPGELSPTPLRTNRALSPGEVNTRQLRSQSAMPLGRVIAVTPTSPPNPRTSRENSNSRSLHKSDLHQRERSWTPISPHRASREGSPSSQKSPPRSQSPRHSSKGSSPKGYQPASRPPIHVTIPPMDAYDSSGYSKERYGYGDTSGDVSSISGGDF